MKRSYQVGVVLLITIAVLQQMETDCSKFTVSESEVLNVNHKDLFSFISHPDTVEMWFQWISHFRAADMKPLSVGKMYHAMYNTPFIGEHPILLNITEYKPNFKIVLESKSFFNLKAEIVTIPVTPDRTQLTLKMTFQKKSFLFQHTFGRLLHFLAQQHLKTSITFLGSL